ncbi:hypothetical protein L1887_61793 [Cichorium endivia]|nr:hypothetical protein L1887_61793 [Cichorium endivia]
MLERGRLRIARRSGRETSSRRQAEWRRDDHSSGGGQQRWRQIRFATRDDAKGACCGHSWKRVAAETKMLGKTARSDGQNNKARRGGARRRKMRVGFAGEIRMRAAEASRVRSTPGSLHTQAGSKPRCGDGWIEQRDGGEIEAMGKDAVAKSLCERTECERAREGERQVQIDRVGSCRRPADALLEQEESPVPQPASLSFSSPCPHPVFRNWTPEIQGRQKRRASRARHAPGAWARHARRAEEPSARSGTRSAPRRKSELETGRVDPPAGTLSSCCAHASRLPCDRRT